MSSANMGKVRWGDDDLFGFTAYPVSQKHDSLSHRAEKQFSVCVSFVTK